MDILVNNAGVSGLEFGKTQDNLETTYATNYFGHFLLTNLLLGKYERDREGGLKVEKRAGSAYRSTMKSKMNAIN